MKCKYCGKETNKEYCDFDCRKAYLDYSDDEDKYAEHKKPFIILSVLVSIPVMVLFYGAGVTVMCTLIGLVLITHPFSSKELKKKVYPKAIKDRIRINGLIIILIGLPFLLLTGTWLSL